MSKAEKKRIDVLLVEQGFFETRQKAQAAVMAGIVYVKEEKIDKAGTKIAEDAAIEVRGNACPYVSRGGLKLEKALKIFNINLDGVVCLDAGASTGGFTDCLLQHGASLVYAVDVGYGQIDWKLRTDNRVRLLERINIRHLQPEELYPSDDSPKATLCVMDLSFISVTKVLTPIMALLEEPKSFIVLIKPQFEAGRELVPKSGVVRDKDVHVTVLKNIFQYCCSIGLTVSKLAFSPVKGTTGNIEYLCYLTQGENTVSIDESDIESVVMSAQKELSNA